MNILMLGIQGSGKGTQGKLLASELGVHHISTGEMFRAIDENSKIGKEARKYMNKGVLVPTPIVTRLLKALLKKKGVKKGVVLEGYPRDIEQVKLLQEFLILDHVILLDISDKEAQERLTGRRLCKSCNTNYNIYTEPKPEEEGICDKCGCKLIQRKDETVEAIRERIETYHEETEPLIEFYKNKGILIQTDGQKPIKEVHEDIIKLLGLA